MLGSANVKVRRKICTWISLSPRSVKVSLKWNWFAGSYGQVMP